MTARRRKTKATIQAIGAGVLFSTGGAAVKTPAFSVLQVASIRSGIAAVVLLIYFKDRARWSRPAAMIGVVYAATLVLFVAATKLTTAAGAIFLQSTAPLYVALLAPLMLGERFRPRDVWILAAVGAGLTFCLAGTSESTVTAPDPWTGNVLGAICGVTWALTLLGLRWSARVDESAAAAAVIVGNAVAFLAGVPALWPVPAAPVVEWATLVYLGVFQIGVAYIMLTRAVGALPILHVSLLLLLEPVLNPVWAWLVRGEQPGAWALVGGGIILAASAAHVTAAGREPTALPTART